MASTRLKAQRFSVIMTDLIMPHSDGFEFLGHARVSQPLTPVIAMTGRCDGDTARTALAKGAFDLLWKPLDRDDLMQVIRCSLATYSLRDMIDRQTVRLRRLSQLIERAQQRIDSSGPRFADVLDRTRRVEQSSLDCLIGNVQVLTAYLALREHHLGSLRERLASRLGRAHTRALGRLAAVAPHTPRFG